MPQFADFVQLIDGLQDASPDKGIHLIDPRFRESFLPYPDLFQRVLELADGFQSQGARDGHRVLVALDTNTDSICSFLALVYLGAVPFSIQSSLMGQDRAAHQRRLAKLAQAHGVDLVLSSRDLDAAAEDLRQTPLVAVPPGAGDPSRVKCRTVSPSDVAFVQFSSGSTSNPKGVQITHRNVVYNTNLIAENDRRTEDSVWVSWLPLYHDMGLVGGLLTNFILKNTLVLMHPRCFIARPISWLAAITKWRGTVTAIPNFALDICSERITDEQLEEHPLDLSSFRYIYNGSEPVHPKSLQRFEERFGNHGFGPGRIFPVYGMSETTLIISAPDFDESVVVREIEGMDVPSVGYPLGDFKVRIRDDDGIDQPSGRIGEIWVCGTSLTPGYLEAPGQDAGVILDGWLATGDLGLLDEEGRLYISGRKKDLIIFQGRNYYGHDIATRIGELPDVRTGKVFAFGIDVEGHEEVVVITVPPKGTEATGGDGPGDLDEFKMGIRKFVIQEFGLTVHDVCVVPQIPKTTSGKVMRHRCEQIYREARRRASSQGS